MIESTKIDVGDILIDRQTHSYKQQSTSVVLMTQILDTSNIELYANACGKLEWEHAMQHEIYSL